MKIHIDLLDKKRQKIFTKLSVFSKYGYLAGGTALSLQIGHRISYDFDIFCPHEISHSLKLAVKKHLAVKKILINTTDELTFLTKADVKVSFIYYPFKIKHNLMSNAKTPIKLLSIKGIAASKAYTLGRRGKWRDYLDLYFILKNKYIELPAIIKQAKNIYKNFFNEKLFLSQLLYTDDISDSDIQEANLLKEKVNVSRVKKFFSQQIKEYVNLPQNYF
ncbi:MAG: nucleotidyl transferase AbiEii/AbiGii toxin family protein [Candidatus Falkowbacteria bacterium]